MEMALFLADFRSDVAGQLFDKCLINQCRLPMQRAIRLGPAHLAKSNGIAGGSPSKLDPAPPPARRQMAAPSMSCHLLIRSAITEPTPAAMNIARVGWPDRHVDGVAIVEVGSDLTDTFQLTIERGVLQLWCLRVVGSMVENRASG